MAYNAGEEKNGENFDLQEWKVGSEVLSQSKIAEGKNPV